MNLLYQRNRGKGNRLRDDFFQIAEMMTPACHIWIKTVFSVRHNHPLDYLPGTYAIDMIRTAYGQWSIDGNTG
jgi:hypothetical protein